MEKDAFTKVNLSDVRVIMVIMRVPVVELLCQVAMGWIPVLKYLLSGTQVLKYLLLGVTPGIKCHHFLRCQFSWCLPGIEAP
jgi:hypothetical protein